jgi:hypothetical protein
MASILGNSAEIQMARGNLEQATSLFQEALALELSCNGNNQGGKSRKAYGWAVALDRAGQIDQARAVLTSYAPAQGLEQLPQTTVFLPPAESHAYLAVAYAAMGDTTSAISHGNAYLREERSSPWATWMRRNLSRWRRAARAR